MAGLALGLAVGSLAAWILATLAAGGGPPIESAWRVAWTSDVMTVVTIGMSVALWALVGAIRRRTVSPSTGWRKCVSFGSFDEIQARRCLASTARWTRDTGTVGLGEDSASAAAAAPSLAAWLTSGVGLVVLAMVAVAVLAPSGHFPGDGVAVVPITLALLAVIAATAFAAALLVRSQLRETSLGPRLHAQLVRRGPHVMVVASAVEVALALSTAAVVAVLAHTLGTPAPSIHEVAAVAILARLVTMTPAPGLALGWADGFMIVGLTMIDTPVAVAIAATVVWRSTQFATTTWGWLAARRTSNSSHPVESEPAAPTNTALGQAVHRSVFALVAMLPGGWSRTIRRRLFDAMFGMAKDPWDYAQMPYELRKQERLVEAMPSEPKVVLEIGCAGGHNLIALAIRNPRSTIIGVDISAKAVSIARDRVRPYENVTVAVADFSELGPILGAHAGNVDALVLSEVLYYVGVAGQLDHALRPVRDVLIVGAHVVLLHGASDGDRLHAAACIALEAAVNTSGVVDDIDRPYVITTGVVRKN